MHRLNLLQYYCFRQLLGNFYCRWQLENITYKLVFWVFWATVVLLFYHVTHFIFIWSLTSLDFGSEVSVLPFVSKHISFMIVAFVCERPNHENFQFFSDHPLHECSCFGGPCSGISRWVQPLVKRPDHHGWAGEEEPFCHRFGAWCVAICQVQQQPRCCQIQLPGVQGAKKTINYWL